MLPNWRLRESTQCMEKDVARRCSTSGARFRTGGVAACCTIGSRPVLTSGRATRFYLVAFSAAMSSVRACLLKLHFSSAAVKQLARSLGKRCKRWAELREEGGTCGGRGKQR